MHAIKLKWRLYFHSLHNLVIILFVIWKIVQSGTVFINLYHY